MDLEWSKHVMASSTIVNEVICTTAALVTTSNKHYTVLHNCTLRYFTVAAKEVPHVVFFLLLPYNVEYYL